LSLQAEVPHSAGPFGNDDWLDGSDDVWIPPVSTAAPSTIPSRTVLPVSNDCDEDFDFETDDTPSPLSWAHFGGFVDRICTAIANYQSPLQFSGRFSFHPEQVFPGEFQTAIDHFDQTRDSESILRLDWSEFNPNIACQVEMIRFLDHPETDLSRFADLPLDSRISSLLHFLLSSNDDSAIHLLLSIEAFLGAPDVAPISSFFPAFTLENLIQKLCQILTSLFPGNREARAAIDRLTRFIASSAAPIVEDEDDDFADLRVGRGAGALLSLTVPSKLEPLNPLENCQPLPFEPITVDPPFFVTFEPAAGHLTASQFSDWVSSIGKPTSTRATLPPAPVPSFPVQVKSSVSDPVCFEVRSAAETIDQFMNLIDHLADPQAIVLGMPVTDDPEYFGLVWPFAQFASLHHQWRL
jgi:hypothetical protein